MLEIGVGTVKGNELGNALLDPWPSYLAYVTSFFVIGIIWINHS